MEAAEKKSVEYVPDAAWIFALWKLIHGGDPSPEKIAGQVIASMTTFLTGTSSIGLPIETLNERLESLGLTATRKKGPIQPTNTCPEGTTMISFNVLQKPSVKKIDGGWEVSYCMPEFPPPGQQAK